jgi:hypothetical protein
MAIRKFSISSINNIYKSISMFDKNNTATLSRVECLVVAGGGGGGYDAGGGGGAGGFVYKESFNVSVGSTYQITVGAAGSASTGSAATNGGNSVFGSLTAIGGGRGSDGIAGSGSQQGADGGSGGGSSYKPGQSGTQNYVIDGGAGTSGQGNYGGTGYHVNSQAACGGGGGGAGGSGTDMVQNGSNINPRAAGDGGNGLPCNITGTSVFYAGGGGGGANNDAGNTGPGGRGGLGGGGDGSRTGNGSSATANTGGGGGAGCRVGGNGGAGGSGVVIIAYPNTYPNISSISGSLTYTLDTTTRPGYKVYRFTQGSATIIL